jgi:hypothetical protein
MRDFYLRDFVDAAGIERVTAAYAPQRKPRAARQAVTRDGFARVARARGIKTAAWAEHWADGNLVAANQE